jgi:glycosyltransferase involved in cell wall biosynthesis
MALNRPSVMIVQQGARRNYVYADQLHAAGLLHSLVTDAAWHADATGLRAQFYKRYLPRRKVTGIPASKLHSSVLPNIAAGLKWVMHEERAFPLIDEALSRSVPDSMLDGVDVVLNYFGNGGSLLDRAKRAGAKIATDFIITPRYLEIEREEHARWPGWEDNRTSDAVVAQYLARMARLLELSDIYLCPSQSVARDLATLPGFDPARVKLLPYGVSGVLLRPKKTVKGRVLFAGAAGLRKGLPYLAEAATELRRHDQQIEIVVAGSVSDRVRNLPQTQALTFLGAIDRNRMAEEFAKADVFCLPSLAEGSATTVKRSELWSRTGI